MCIIKILIDKGARDRLHHHIVTPFPSTQQCPNRHIYPQPDPLWTEESMEIWKRAREKSGKVHLLLIRAICFPISCFFFSSCRESWTKGSFAVVARGDLYPLPMCQRNAGDSVQHNSNGQSNSSSSFWLWFCNYCLLLVVDSSFIASKIVGVKNHASIKHIYSID